MKTPVQTELSRWVMLGLALINVFGVIVVSFFLVESRQQHLGKAATTAENLTQLLEQQVSASLRQIDISLRAMGDVAQRGLNEGKSLRDQKLAGLLTQYQARLPIADRLLLADAKGNLIASSNFDAALRFAIDDYDYFQRSRDEDHAGLIIGQAARDKNSGHLVLPFARRLSQLDGSFAGALIVLVETDSYARMLGQVNAGSQGSVALLDDLLHPIAYHPQPGEQALADSYTDGGRLNARLQREDIRSGNAVALSLEGRDHLVSLRRSQDWPFHIRVDLLADDYLAAWQQELRFSMVALLAFLVGSLFAGRFLLRIANAQLAAQAESARLARFNTALLQAIPVPVFFKDAAGRYLGCNPAYTDILGYTSEALRGRDTAELWPAELARIYLQKDRELLDSQEPQVYESLIRDKHGHSREVLFARNTFLDDKDQVAGIIGTFIDITDRKRSELEIQEARLAAESASRAKSQFLATMSHEIRTPLNGILGMAQVMLMTASADEEIRDYARTILNSGQTLLALLNDILDLSKIEAGKLQLEPRSFEPPRLLEDTMALFAEAAQQKGLSLVGEWDEHLREPCRGDPIRLRQMLANLVSNAIKFSEKGEIRLQVSRDEGRSTLPSDPMATRLRFSVSDCGIGIAPEQQQLLFKPFSQTDSSSTRKFGGTGLGLSIVRNLAELMQGEVGVDSRPGQGATFWFTACLERLPERNEKRTVVRNPLVTPLPETLPRTTRPGHILVVDDNATNRKVVSALLKKAGYDSDAVDNGEEAVARLTNPTGSFPDLILMDCEMPVMDGFAATEAIRHWEKTHSRRPIPIVAFTAGVFEQDRQRCLNCGMDDFLPKPINAQSLKAILEKWLQQAEICD